MTNQIRNYKELQQEKARLNALLAKQELQIKEDWQLIKADLKPAVLAVTAIRKFLTRKGGMSAVQLGVNLFTDGFVKKVLLARTGWFTRLLVPLLIKNYASHMADGPEKILQKIKNLFGKNKKADQDTGMEAV